MTCTLSLVGGTASIIGDFGGLGRNLFAVPLTAAASDVAIVGPRLYVDRAMASILRAGTARKMPTFALHVTAPETIKSCFRELAKKCAADDFWSTTLTLPRPNHCPKFLRRTTRGVWILARTGRTLLLLAANAPPVMAGSAPVWAEAVSSH